MMRDDENMSFEEVTRYGWFLGEEPTILCGRHPSEPLVAMQVDPIEPPHERVAVWDTTTADLVWAPENALALCWRGADEVVLLREQYSDDGREGIDPSRRSPHGAYTYYLERHSWPPRNLLAVCPLRLCLPDARPSAVTLSPGSDLAVVQWFSSDPPCEGIELVALQPRSAYQLDNAGYRAASNDTTRPVFSPDGRYLAIASRRDIWWTQQPNAFYDVPSEGGQFTVGQLVLLDLQAAKASGHYRYHEIDLEENVPAGWLCEDSQTGDEAELSQPRFVGPTDLTITLPISGTQHFHVPNWIGAHGS